MYHIKVNGVTLRAAAENRSSTDIDPYKELANAVILQAVEDYRKWTKDYSGRLIADDYNRSLHGQRLRTEHKLKAAIRHKKQALGLKENPLENPQFK